MLEKVIENKGQTNALAFFLANPERTFFIGELKKRLSSKKLGSDLQMLLRGGFVTSFAKRARKYFKLNRRHPQYEELRSTIAKTAKKYEDELYKEIKKLKGLKLAILTGLFIGPSNQESDLLLVGKLSQHQLEKLVKGMEKIMGQEINYVVMEPKEYEYRINIFDRFTKDILENEHLVVVNKIGNRK